MSAEKFFGEKDILVKDIGGSLAYGKSSEDKEVVERIHNALLATETQADEIRLATYYDIASIQYPEAPNTMLQEILSNKEKYIPYLAAQLKDLFVKDYAEAAEKDKGYI